MIRFLIHRPTSVLAVIIGLLILASITLQDFVVSLLPDVAIPHITILVSAPGYAPLEVERQLLQPIRRRLSPLAHLEDISSTAHWGNGEIHLKFAYGSEMEKVFIETHEMIDLSMNSLPDDVTRPRVIKSRSEDLPTHYLSLRYRNAALHHQIEHLSTYAKGALTSRLEQLEEIALVDVHGWQNIQISITPDEPRMAALGIDQYSFQQALKQAHLSFGSVIIKERAYQYRVRIGDPITSIREIQAIKLRIGSRTIAIGELATVASSLQDQEAMFIDQGQAAISLAIIKSPKASLANLEEKLQQIIHQVNGERGDLSLSIYRDQTSLLQATLSNLNSSLILGSVLAIGLVFFFYNQWRIPVIIGIIIPTSMVLSLLGFRAFGMSINMISLSGILLGLGLMIDNGIIVLDNISQSWTASTDLLEACVSGTGEMVAPLLTSMLTTCSVFLPLTFLSGMSGALFGAQAMAISIGLLVSYLVSITLLPTLYYMLLKDRHRPSVMKHNALAMILRRLYDLGFHVIFNHRWLTGLTVFAIIALGVFLAKELPVKRFPRLPQDSFEMQLDWNQPIRPELAQGRLQEVFHDLPIQWYAHVGADQYLLNTIYQGDISNATIYIKPESMSAKDQIEEEISKRMDRYPRSDFSFSRAQNLFEQLFPEEEHLFEIQCHFTTRDESIQRQQYQDILADLRDQGVGELVGVDYQKGYIIEPQADKLLQYNVDPARVISELRRQLSHNQLLELKSFQYRVPVVIHAPDRDISTLHSDTKIKSRDNQLIALKHLVRISEQRSQRKIFASSHGRYWPIGIQDAEQKLLTNSLQELERHYPTVDFQLRDYKKARKNLVLEILLASGVALLILFFLITAQFGSFVQPLIILLEIPISLTGSLALLWLLGGSINIMSLIGMVVSTGIIINDSIIKIDTINRLRRHTSTLKEAVHLGGLKRLNPIVMTSLTTILATMPFLWGDDLGSMLQRPLALSLIGGMLVGTLVSLYVIPLCYYLIYKSSR